MYFGCVGLAYESARPWDKKSETSEDAQGLCVRVPGVQVIPLFRYSVKCKIKLFLVIKVASSDQKTLAGFVFHSVKVRNNLSSNQY